MEIRLGCLKDYHKQLLWPGALNRDRQMRSLHQNTRRAAELYRRKDKAYTTGQPKRKNNPSTRNKSVANN